MSYQANVDIVIALNMLQISSFRKQGYLRFKVSLAHRLKKVNELSATKIEDDSFCSPYNIYKQPKQSPLIVRDLRKVHTLSGNKMNLQYLHQYEKQQQQSYIDHEQECYYSKVMQSKFQSQLHKIEECCYFRKYIDTQDIQHSCFVLKVELLFRPHADQNYIQAGFYEAVIHRISGFSAYLPVEFDQLGGFAISALYHAIVMEYKFEGQDGKQQYNSFEDYLVAATKGIHYDQFMNFYSYYRGSLESQLGMIQERHAQLLNVLRINTQFSITRVNQNQVILNLTTFLNNSHQTHQHHSLKYNQQLRERLCEEITKDFVFIKALIHQKWNQFIIFVCTNISALTQYYKGNYDIHVKDRFKTHVFSHKIQPKWDWTYSRYEDSGKELLLQAEMDKMKHKEEELWREQFPIEGTHLFSQQKKTIKIFEEVYQVRGALLTQRSLSPTASHRSNIQPNRFSTMQQGRSYSPRSYEFQPHFHSAKEISEFSPFKLHRPPLQVFPNFQSKEHVVIFVHGFQASRQDFVLFKSCLEILYGCRVFISSTNEGRTQESIEILGKHLAVELNQLFKTIEFTPNTRISFVGHSMGGIIIRSALSYIKNLQPYLYSYLSFSSPHLGYMYQPSKLIKAGLWLLNAFQNVKSLQELCMKDNHDTRRSLIYRLSENNSFHGFKKLALISSSQDQYVPYESARVQKNQKLMHQLGYLSSTIVKEMVDNLLGQICATEISRMNVVFNIEDKNFDSIVGRTAHIKYLSDQKFIKMFSIVFQKYFA